MLTVLIPRSSRRAALSVAIAGTSAMAGLLEPVTGCFGLVMVVLVAHFFDRSFGRLAAGFVSLGIAGTMLTAGHPPLSSGSIGRCALAIGAAWLCAELVSRRPRHIRYTQPPDSTAHSKDDDVDLEVRQALTASESRELIRKREAQLNWLIENVPSLLWRTDAHGRLEYVNKRAEDYTGLRFEDLKTRGWLHLVHPDDAASTLEAWQDSRASGRPYDSVHRFRAADNTYRWFQCKGTPMRNANGDIVNWYGLSTDIHERQLAQEVLRTEELNLDRKSVV